MAGTTPDDVSEETLRAVAETRARAAALPSADELADLLIAAAKNPGDTTAEQIRVIGAVAVRQAQEVSFLLGELAGRLGDDGKGG